MNIVEILTQAWGTFLNELARFAPRLLAALIILLAGSLLARLVRVLVRKALDLTRFEVVAEKSGIDDFLRKGGIGITLRDLLAGIGYWLVILLSFLIAANSLRLEVVAQLFTQVTAFIPNVLVAILILVFGAVMARFLGGLVQAFAQNIGVEGSRTMANIATYALMIFVVFVALEQLKIGMEILASAFKIGFGAICLALALAFGLGGRDLAAEQLGRLKRNLEGPTLPPEA
ncbi:MAG TPA: hypothetical protein VJ483_09030 [Holophagaceae bacterium]|nr:hypothetical protein [Holophagaceae bacterium]